ncbi:MAG: carboxypeptidase regulatory-like domain-containing protein [Ignavibacteriales bacterium]
MERWLKLVSLALFFLFLGGATYGYEVIQVTDGGTIKGKVKFVGMPPKDETIRIDKNQDYCGNTLPANKYIISPGGEIQNVVVMIEGIDKGKPFPKEAAVVNNYKCAFDPKVVIGFEGDELEIKNSDPILHNTHLYQDGKALYNIALPDKDESIKRPMKKAGLIDVKCNTHKWMSGYIYISEHPYIMVTGADGSFTLTDVPPGKYKLKAWHAVLGEVTKDVEVVAGKSTEVNFEFTK